MSRWEFVKAHPWMFGVAGALTITIAVLVVYAIIKRGNWADRGLMVRDGKKLKWLKEDLPLTVFFAPGLPEWVVIAFRSVRVHLSEAIGREMFDMGTHAPEALGLRGPFASPTLTIGIGSHEDHAFVEPGYNKKTGRMQWAYLEMGQMEPDAFLVMLHELGHVLGLDHDEQVQSIMHPQLQSRPGELTDSDRELLRSLYG